MGMQDPNGRPGTDTENRRVLCDPNSDDYLQYLVELGRNDGIGLVNAHKHYGNSWKKRGGVSAFMMLCRKWDRLEKFLEEHGWDIFKALDADERGEGLIDDIRDLRRYLLLVEAEAKARGIKCASAGHRDNLVETAAAAQERAKKIVVGGEGTCLSGPHRVTSEEDLAQAMIDASAANAERQAATYKKAFSDRDPGPSRSVSNPQGGSVAQGHANAVGMDYVLGG